MIQNFAPILDSRIEKGFPEIHIENIQKIPDTEQSAIEQALALTCGRRDEQSFAKRISALQGRFLNTVFLNPE